MINAAQKNKALRHQKKPVSRVKAATRQLNHLNMRARSPTCQTRPKEGPCISISFRCSSIQAGLPTRRKSSQIPLSLDINPSTSRTHRTHKSSRVKIIQYRHTMSCRTSLIRKMSVLMSMVQTRSRTRRLLHGSHSTQVIEGRKNRCYPSLQNLSLSIILTHSRHRSLRSSHHSPQTSCPQRWARSRSIR